MKIVSWNCHYGLTKENIEQLFKAENGKFAGADVYAFQEVLENEFINISDYEGTQDYKYRHWYGDHQEYGDCHVPRGSEGDLGIVLMSNKYKISRIDQGLIRFRYVIPYCLENENEKFYLFHVWTKSKPDGYIETIYKALEYYKQYKEFNNLNTPIVMLGDFNFGVNYEDPFFKTFENKIQKSFNNMKLLTLKGDNTQSFYYPRCRDQKYFNDAVYVQNLNGNFSIGNTKDWIQAYGAASDYSDHCPILAEINLIK